MLPGVEPTVGRLHRRAALRQPTNGRRYVQAIGFPPGHVAWVEPTVGRLHRRAAVRQPTNGRRYVQAIGFFHRAMLPG